MSGGSDRSGANLGYEFIPHIIIPYEQWGAAWSYLEFIQVLGGETRGTLWEKSNIAIERGPFIVDSPIEDGDVP